MVDSAFTFWLQGQGLASRTVQQTLSRLQTLTENKALTEEGYWRFISTIPRDKAPTMNKYVSAIKKYIEFYDLTWRHIPKRIAEHQRNPEVFTDAEIESIIKESKEPFATYLAVLAFGGLRPSEPLQLYQKHVNWQLRTLSIENTKTHLDRIVPIHDSLTDRLQAINTEKLFLFKYDAAAYQLKLVCGKLGIKNKTLNCLRHSKATRDLDNGANLLVVKELMGWKKTETVERYYHQSLTQLRLLIENDMLGFTAMSWSKKLKIIAERLKDSLSPIKQDPDLDYSVTETNEEIVIRVSKKGTKK